MQTEDDEGDEYDYIEKAKISNLPQNYQHTET